MAFNPQLLLDLANKLYEDPNYDDEARYRTSISRAYYAAYLTARCKLESTCINFTKKSTAHEEVSDALRDIDKHASNMLYNLRKHRNKADYNLDIKIQKGQALACLKSSKFIVDKFDT